MKRLGIKRIVKLELLIAIYLGIILWLILMAKAAPSDIKLKPTGCPQLEVKETISTEEIVNIVEAQEAAKEEEEIAEPVVQTNNNYLGVFKLTGYDDCEQCQGEWVGTTALGVMPQVNHTIAVDPSIIPLGSHVMINGIEYVAEDVGGGVKGNHIDIFVGSHEESYSDFCNGYAEVYLVQ